MRMLSIPNSPTYPMSHAPSFRLGSLLLTALSAVLVTPHASAQDFIAEYEGDAAGDRFGWALDGAGDVNADGVPDIIVGIPMDDTIGPDVGAARVISGADGTTLHNFYGDFFFDEFGYSVAGAGDVNNDGHADLIVGARYDDDNGADSGSAWVFSGADGALLHTFYGDSGGDNFGHSVDGLGDINGDGFGDVIVGAIYDDDGAQGAGSATVFSGQTGLVLWENNPNIYGHYGATVCGLGDVDGDSIPDWAVGAQRHSSYGRASVYSGATGVGLYHVWGSSTFGSFASTMCAAGDLNGDSHADVLIGDRATQRVRAYSGIDGALLHEYTNTSCWAVAGDLDLNGDGTPDLIIGNIGTDVLAYSGQTWGSLFSKNTSGSHRMTVASISDIDGDGFSDFAVGEYQWDSDKGRMTFYSGFGGGEPIKPFCIGDGIDELCPCDNNSPNSAGCANSTGNGALLTHTGTHSIERDDLRFVVTAAIPSQPCLLIQGTTQISIPFRDGRLCMGNPTERMEVIFLDAAGTSMTTISISTDGNVVPAQKRYYQAWYRDPYGVSPCGFNSNFTNGIEVLWRI